MTVFLISDQSPVLWSGQNFAECDGIVIGAGVIGVCTALFLACTTKRVTVLEKRRIAGVQSSCNWDRIRQQGRDLDEIAILIEAHRLWRELAEDPLTDFGLKNGGVTYLVQTDQDKAQYAAWLPHERSQLWHWSGYRKGVGRSGHGGRGGA